MKYQWLPQLIRDCIEIGGLDIVMCCTTMEQNWRVVGERFDQPVNVLIRTASCHRLHRGTYQWQCGMRPQRLQTESCRRQGESKCSTACRRNVTLVHGLLARYVILWVAHAPGMSGTFPPPSRLSDSDMHHGTCVTHVPWCIPGSLTSGFLWIRWRGERSWHFRCMRNPQFYIYGKRPMSSPIWITTASWQTHLYTRWGQQLTQCILPRITFNGQLST